MIPGNNKTCTFGKISHRFHVSCQIYDAKLVNVDTNGIKAKNVKKGGLWHEGSHNVLLVQRTLAVPTLFVTKDFAVKTNLLL